MWRSWYTDENGGFTKDNVKRCECYVNGELADALPQEPEKNDVKVIFYGEDKARVVNMPDGYVVTLPSADFKPDYFWSAQRARYVSDNCILNISREDKNPYANKEGCWNIYLTEWVERYIANDQFLSDNNIARTRETVERDDMIEGYTVRNYDLYINDPCEIAMPYYNIAVVRKVDENILFHLFVMKSATDNTAAFDEMIRSFKEIWRIGTAKNADVTFDCPTPDYWNDETKAYFEKLKNNDHTEWGFFRASMVDKDDSSYDYQAGRIQRDYDRMKNLLGGYDYEIMPPYTHLMWGSRPNVFALEQARQFAGGNGFDGKPVLQFTYQFTASNNESLAAYTPTFDIMRGKYDEQLRKLARDIKAYHHPVLFRLNNEMNTDWTSYSGIVNLLDPDVFIMTWERLYRIFMEEGVDNTMWIFNPISVSTPYSNWGEYYTYIPKPECVQILGLTAYERGNETDNYVPFELHYRRLYQKNQPYFNNYPWVISEFGAGAGGDTTYNYEEGRWVFAEKGRHLDKQVRWIDEMFECFAHRTEPGFEFCKNIKGAIWFGANDPAFVDGKEYVMNYFELDDGVLPAIEALRRGINP